MKTGEEGGVATDAPLRSAGQALERTLPSSWYVRPDVFALEREHIFFREWVCVGREQGLDAPGSHRVIDWLGQSVLLVRNRERRLRAYYNVCRHRGARLCAPPPAPGAPAPLLRGGVVPEVGIVCPYHAWTYDLDGRLAHTPHLQTVTTAAGAEVRLYPVGIAAWGGFVFLHLTPAVASDPVAHLDRTCARLVRYPLESLRVAHTIEYRVAANWKIICENYNECYHCGPVHPELCRIVPAFREQGGSNLDWSRGIPHRDGADTFTASGTSSRRSFPGLNAEERVRHNGELVYPNLFLSLAREHVAAFMLEPIAPQETRVTCSFLFEPHEIERPGFDSGDVVGFWDLVNRQDWDVCAAVQAGVGARVHEAGVFAPMEDFNLDIRRYVTERIGAYLGCAAQSGSRR
jgi:Rieske 2Fe-2S family protein